MFAKWGFLLFAAVSLVYGQADPMIAPATGAVWTIGQTYEILWNPLSPGLISLFLQDPQTLDAAVIYSGLQDTGYFYWTIPTSLSPGTQYQIRLVNEFQAITYSGIFTLAGPASSSSTTVSSTSSTSTSASTTSSSTLTTTSLTTTSSLTSSSMVTTSSMVSSSSAFSNSTTSSASSTALSTTSTILANSTTTQPPTSSSTVSSTSTGISSTNGTTTTPPTSTGSSTSRVLSSSSFTSFANSSSTTASSSSTSTLSPTSLTSTGSTSAVASSTATTVASTTTSTSTGSGSGASSKTSGASSASVTSSSINPGTSSSLSSVQYTTSTHYTTIMSTIIACPSTVTNCPLKSTTVVTATVALYTTVCPVAEAAGTPAAPKSTHVVVGQSPVPSAKTGSASAVSVPAGGPLSHTAVPGFTSAPSGKVVPMMPEQSIPVLGGPSLVYTTATVIPTQTPKVGPFVSGGNSTNATTIGASGKAPAVSPTPLTAVTNGGRQVGVEVVTVLLAVVSMLVLL